jgi:hypothetical protein
MMLKRAFHPNGFFSMTAICHICQSPRVKEGEKIRGKEKTFSALNLSGETGRLLKREGSKPSGGRQNFTVFFAPGCPIFHFPLEIHQKILNINSSQPSLKRRFQ